ncbi:hypothetical protein [Qipengyuania psychrotolerans]|uniref:Serine kinase n=1 Tax=Qipengyuania psychrotolerans TaxID=2867238 RepID=A0ABX8ZHX5_9SPHN|nr:hypothetical protein [Qipengyuania psychrotolerans]QZD87769.1 hypothetical protein K3166_03450 [Qipengyuania psychrotolerans]
MTLFQYRHSGLSVASQLELPEWAEFASEFSELDIKIVIDDGRIADCPRDGSTIVDGANVRFAIDGIGGWQIEGGHTIGLYPGPATNPRELRLFTLGSAWGALGYQRGLAMWHGSAVARKGRAFLFCGDAGAGKSTMAGGMLARGAKLVADDLSRIDCGGDGAIIYPSSARIKLWRAAIDRFGWSDRVLQQDYFRDDKYHCSVPSHAAGKEPVRLSGIVVLENSEDTALDRLNGGEALSQVMRGTTYRPEMLQAMNRWSEQGALAAQIVAKTPVWRLRRPKDYSALGKVCAATEALWDQ